MKVNKYIVKATVQTVALIVGVSAMSAVISLVLNYFNPTGTQILTALGCGVMLFCLYNMISIQASILESKDKLKEMSNK
jgi:hypothetical protein